MNECVIYCRCSTWQQAKGDSLRRQVAGGIVAAGSRVIRAIFTDVGSKTKPLPSRELALRLALQLDCPLLVEAYDRIIPGTAEATEDVLGMLERLDEANHLLFWLGDACNPRAISGY